jgi:hypothetical protein
MLDVDFAALHRMGGLLRSSCVSLVPSFSLPGATGSALAVWTRSVQEALDSLNAAMERFGAAVSACAANYEEVA